MTLKELLDSLTFDEIAPCCENHSFSDGNKRIAAILFLWFMGKTAFFMEKNRPKGDRGRESQRPGRL